MQNVGRSVLKIGGRMHMLGGGGGGGGPSQSWWPDSTLPFMASC